MRRNDYQETIDDSNWNYSHSQQLTSVSTYVPSSDWGVWVSSCCRAISSSIRVLQYKWKRTVTTKSPLTPAKWTGVGCSVWTANIIGPYSCNYMMFIRSRKLPSYTSNTEPQCESLASRSNNELCHTAGSFSCESDRKWVCNIRLNSSDVL